MKNTLGIAGVILILLARQFLLDDDGIRTAMVFLGACLCSAVAFLVVYPLIDNLIGQSSKIYYLRLYEDQLNLQQERIKQMEEELMAKRKQQ